VIDPGRREVAGYPKTCRGRPRRLDLRAHALRVVALTLFAAFVAATPAPGAPELWGPNLRVNHGGGDVHQEDPQLVLGAEGNLYVVWEDWRHPTGSVYFTRSTDGGASFEMERRVDPEDPSARGLLLVQWPRMAVDGNGVIFVAWVSWQVGETGRVYCAHSSDQGLTFSEQRLVSDSARNDRAWPDIAGLPSGGACLVWGDFRNGEDVIDLYTSRTLDGESFSANVRANQASVGPACTAPWPRISAGGGPGSLILVWRQTLAPNARWIYTCRSSDGGMTFQPAVEVSHDPWFNDG